MPLAVDFQGGVSSAWSNVITFVPSWPPPCSSSWSATCSPGSSPSSTRSWNGSGSTGAVERGGSSRPWPGAVRPLRHHRQAGLLAHLPGQPADRLRGVRPQPDQRPAPGPDRLPAQRVRGHRHHRGRCGHRQGSNRPALQPALQRLRRPGHGQGGGIAVLVSGPSRPWTGCRSPPDRHRPVVRDLAIVVGSAVVAVGGGGIKTMQRYWDGWPPAPRSAPPARPGAQQSTSDEGNGAAVYADTGTQEFAAQRPSRPRRDR